MFKACVLVKPASLSLRLGLKLSFLIKFIIADGSGFPEIFLSYAAMGLDCFPSNLKYFIHAKGKL